MSWLPVGFRKQKSSGVVEQPVLNLPQLSQEEIAANWQRMGGDEAYEESERRMEEASRVSPNIFRLMIR